MRCIFIGQHTRKTHALSDEDGAGAGIRTRTSSMACSCAAVEHHARICRAAELDAQANDDPRAGAPQPGTLAIHVVKDRPPCGAAPPSRSGTSNCNCKQKRPETCVDPGVWGLSGSGAGLACTPTRIDLARIPIDLRALVLDDWRICPIRGRNAAEAGHRFLGARQPGSSPVS